ncbi:SSU ribosomal protein S16e (S9p) [Candidatus Methanomethylophilus alvi Mx1201]|jgi:small subunit ribosomal protein S9|uniref:Small ribosomal subunit protein uS9 n=2 Tax=Methanomethylophilus alvi TaxID=1291540 RepID=M9SFK9_METAX|nr:30S ribosomal protein S9 [Methanomethylophilus alvi]CDF30344.1 30S ribosomal protein S9 [Methanoculleus sp. CAG:1088]AGI86200.1 SSU ribosomal protein S16e (S9p) [Candidatus Methanomethylophilus alvi Mx1201]AYQ55571.1 30S ribosomal protein S9 [Methanomethylophilus alvi]MCI5973658.1 30S ribosomal protein S9 [Methanomethylophilus alvi]MDD7480127.1 30S ribosomal protein S9 [Methanomethylophilus alvi]
MDAVNTSGKRKTAIARAVVKEGTGKVVVNKTPIAIYSPELARLKIEEPLQLVPEKAAKVDISVTVQGGGVMGQAAAVRTAIARGLVDFYKDDELEALFRAYDRTLIINDDRRKLPKKPLGRGARAKKQKSYR